LKRNDLFKLLARVLEVDVSMINENLTADQVSSWDSMGHIAILTNLDETLGGIPNDDNFATANSVRKLIETLRTHRLIED